MDVPQKWLRENCMPSDWEAGDADRSSSAPAFRHIMAAEVAALIGKHYVTPRDWTHGRRSRAFRQRR
eukprot:9390806-Pyramimonas_sp.AAC.1